MKFNIDDEVFYIDVSRRFSKVEIIKAKIASITKNHFDEIIYDAFTPASQDYYDHTGIFYEAELFKTYNEALAYLEKQIQFLKRNQE